MSSQALPSPVGGRGVLADRGERAPTASKPHYPGSCCSFGIDQGMRSGRPRRRAARGFRAARCGPLEHDDRRSRGMVLRTVRHNRRRWCLPAQGCGRCAARSRCRGALAPSSTTMLGSRARARAEALALPAAGSSGRPAGCLRIGTAAVAADDVLEWICRSCAADEVHLGDGGVLHRQVVGDSPLEQHDPLVHKGDGRGHHSRVPTPPGQPVEQDLAGPRFIQTA